MRIALVSDAWEPQTNGVVTTLRATAATLERCGYEPHVISSFGMRTIGCPSYPEVRLALAPGAAVAARLRALRPHAIHIATEGPLGLAARRYCVERGLPFTTSYHTRYPEYLRARWPLPIALTYAGLRWFHGGAARTFVASESLRTELTERGFANLHIWRRGVDLTRFAPSAEHSGWQPRAVPAHLPQDMARPIMLYVGRVAVEKNLEAFLELELAGTTLIVGGGPALQRLREHYPRARFAGYRHGEQLVEALRSADVFVFPSLTDTFGIAMLEALACGVPVAAFPVPGPRDLIEPGVTGVLHTDLGEAIRGALGLERSRCAQRARELTWDAATEQFLAGLAPVAQPSGRRARSALALGPASIS